MISGFAAPDAHNDTDQVNREFRHRRRKKHGGNKMTDPETLDVGDLVDRQKISWFHIAIFAIAFFEVLVDGYDIFVPGFLGPELVKSWHIPPAALAPMFTAGLLGIVVGAPIFGWIGDRYGRKRSIIAGSVLYGALTFYSMWATSIGELSWQRFATGVALAGIIPNTLALAAEFAPKRSRATVVVSVCLATSFGLLLPGVVAALYVPTYGWPALLFVGGIAPLIGAAIAYLWLPESIKYLVVSGRDAEVVRIIHKLEPAFELPAGARFKVSGIDLRPGLSPVKLFGDGLAVITAMVWIAFVVALLTNYFVASWLPTLMQAAGASPQQVAGSVGLYALGGVVGSLLIMRLIDRYGTRSYGYFFLASVPCVAAFGWQNLSPVALWLLALGAGMTVSGMLQALNTTLSMIYPTPLRSKGIGWGLAVGRFGAIGGPILGGILVNMHFTNLQIFAVPALLQLVGAVACLVLTRQCVKRFRGPQLDDSAPAAQEDIRAKPAAIVV
jgi:AAHS family 4-hydroxybenzoate transporter-like MFS transporter